MNDGVFERVERLSRREREIFGLLGHGLSNRGIARRLDISERTVKFHVSNVLIKLRVESRLQAGSVACLLRARSPLNGASPRSSVAAAPAAGGWLPGGAAARNGEEPE